MQTHTMPSTIDVVVRCRNEQPFTERTLRALAEQTGLRARVLFFDCGSTDGSREAAFAHGATVIDVDPAGYIPGRVLNAGMRAARGDVVAFVNADAIPMHTDALVQLVRPLFDSPSLAASYGRQLARPDARAITRHDHDRAFGDASPVRTRHGAFFSMAASAIRREVWEAMPFDESLRYSEDVDWTTRARSLGWGFAYAPDARFEHSHDYDLASERKRRAGEGEADTLIHRLGPPRLVTDFVRPWVGAIARDARAGLLSPRSIQQRSAQAIGFFRGRLRAVSP